MTQVMHKAKWLVPLLVIVAMLAAVGIVWSQSGGSGSGGDLGDGAVLNPAYESVIVGPGDSMPTVYYSITCDPPSAIIPFGGGDMCTVTLTNLIPAPIPNVPYVVTKHGDIGGNLTVTADVFNTFNPMGCINVYAPSTNVTVITFPNVVCHPGLTVTFTVPIAPGFYSEPGAVFLLKAELDYSGNPSTTPIL